MGDGGGTQGRRGGRALPIEFLNFSYLLSFLILYNHEESHVLCFSPFYYQHAIVIAMIVM